MGLPAAGRVVGTGRRLPAAARARVLAVAARLVLRPAVVVTPVARLALRPAVGAVRAVGASLRASAVTRRRMPGRPGFTVVDAVTTAVAALRPAGAWSAPVRAAATGRATALRGA
ncbi:hypothetical protein, partial [Micromonospora noduli]|uniref:hypothetical protein n=1 Tax=Micromonospora noduli TaxID=709876 RepID=UPI001B8719D1